MTCTQIFPGVIACSFNETQVYICLESVTYIMEFSRQFGPYWWRLDCGKEIDVYPDPDGHLSFLWDIFGEWYDGMK